MISTSRWTPIRINIDPYLRYEQYNLDLTNAAYAESSFRVYQTRIGLKPVATCSVGAACRSTCTTAAAATIYAWPQSSPYEGNFNSGYALVWQADTLDNLTFPTAAMLAIRPSAMTCRPSVPTRNTSPEP